MGGAIGGLFGGGDTPSSPNVNVYQPSGTSNIDSVLSNLLQSNTSAVTGANNPYSQMSPQISQLFQMLYNNPNAGGYQTAANNAGGAYGTTGTNALNASTALSSTLPQTLAGANSVYQMGVDPQQAYYAQALQKLNDQNNVANAQYGLTGQQAAGNVQNADSNFNIDWQNTELQRALAGLQGYSGAIGTAAATADSANNLGVAGAQNTLAAGATPYNATQAIGTNSQAALQQYIANLLGPVTSSASTIAQDQNYLNTGVSASTAGANAALQDYNAQLQNSSNIGNAIGGILGLDSGSGGSIGGDIWSGVGSLFSAGGSGGANSLASLGSTYGPAQQGGGFDWSTLLQYLPDLAAAA